MRLQTQLTNPLTAQAVGRKVPVRFVPMIAFASMPPSASGDASAPIVQFPTEPARAVRSSRHMTSQLLQEASQVIPDPQLLINVVSRRVRQLGLGHRPLVEATPRASLTDIALKEIIAGKLTYEVPAPDGAEEE
jgi:DNA-directed RNA polymerase subunit omega